mmetsp:Transcript_11139/g.34618  ORF Transcript_11139/g.34618 Transcript_11139/m.34618 type:complete len:687 (-) Transcript_11139:266-2326(-)
MPEVPAQLPPPALTDSTRQPQAAPGAGAGDAPSPKTYYFVAGITTKPRHRPTAAKGGFTTGAEPNTDESAKPSPPADAAPVSGGAIGDAANAAIANVDTASNGTTGTTRHVDPTAPGEAGDATAGGAAPVTDEAANDASAATEPAAHCTADFAPAAKPGRSAGARPSVAMSILVTATYRGINRRHFTAKRLALYRERLQKAAAADAANAGSNGAAPRPADPPVELGPGGELPDACFRDSNSYFVPLVGEEIHDRFVVLEPLGSGSFGTVLRCFDQQRAELVAVKVLRAESRFTLQGRTEARILTDIAAAARPELFATVGTATGAGSHLREAAADAARRMSASEGRVVGADHVLKLRKAFEWRGHVCIVTELLGKSLYDLLRISHFQGVSLRLTAKFGIQIGRALQLLGSLKKPVVHVDVKPENILLVDDRRSAIKLVDFGSSCYEALAMKAQYAQSRFCRAPEVMLRLPYDRAVDTWSAATVLFEMHVGTPLFDGKSEPMQLQLFQRCLGPMPASFVKKSRKVRLFRMVPQEQPVAPTPLDPDVIAALPEHERGDPDPNIAEQWFELLSYEDAAQLPGGVAEPDESRQALWDSVKPVSVAAAAARLKTEILRKRDANVKRAERRRGGEASRNTPPVELPKHIDVFCLLLARMLRFDPEDRCPVQNWSADPALALASEPAPAAAPAA